MGRPAKLDDVILLPAEGGGKVPRIRWEVIVERIRSGIPIETAVVSTGVGTTTYYRWREWGEDRWVDGKLVRARPAYRAFRDATTRARAEGLSVHVAHVAKGAEKDWRASAWFLERADPGNFGRRDVVALTGGADGDPEIRVRATHGIDPAAASKLGDLLDLVERATEADARGPGEEPRTDPGDGGAS